MHPTPEPDPQGLDPAARACFARTRSVVLNVLVADGLMIAISGWLLRRRAQAPPPPASSRLGQALIVGLIVLVLASYVIRRVLGRRASLDDPTRRARLFFWSHVLSAAISALAIPLGLAYGWLISPSLDAVIPFWVAAIALGSLAMPRAGELSDFDRPMPGAGAPPT